MAAAACDACAKDPIDGWRPPYTPHILCDCPKVWDIWLALEAWISRFCPGVVLSSNFLLLPMASSQGQQRLKKEAWWRHLKAWLLYGIWTDWSVALYEMQVAASSLQIIIKAWYAMVRAARVAWYATKVDPVKGRKDPDKDLWELGVVSRGSHGQVSWSFVLPREVRLLLSAKQQERAAALEDRLRGLPDSLDDVVYEGQTA